MDRVSLRSFSSNKKEELVLTVAEGYLNTDLNGRLITHPSATYLFTANIDSIEGVQRGDILIVNRALKPTSGSIIVADIHGEYQIRRIIKNGSRWELVTDSEADSPFLMDAEAGFCCGVITYAITRLA